jgi:hypothetical protein
MATHREFCTLFDSNYLFKAVALYRSLERHCPSFRLTAFCYDDDAARILGRLELENIEIVTLAALEAFDPELLAVKPDRSRVEYFWTSTPALPLYVFGTRPEVAEVTYLDADLMFFRDPEPLYEEMGDASVAITPHRYSPEYSQHLHNGVYNVQFLPFRRDDRGLEVLQTWHDQCIEWCYWRLEDGKLGDQKYLDQWPERYEGVHVIEHKGGGLAPWNVSQYKISKEGSDLLVDGDPLIFYHYHQVDLHAGGEHDPRPPAFYLSWRERRRIYTPYWEEIERAIAQVRSVDLGFSAGLTPRPSPFRRLQMSRSRLPLWRARLMRRPRVEEPGPSA